MGGVKALGEPAVNLNQELPGFGALAPALPQPLRLHIGMTAEFLMDSGERSPSGLIQDGDDAPHDAEPHGRLLGSAPLSHVWWAASMALMAH